MKIVTKNKKAYFNYFIKDTYEAGIALKGSEVKSVRAGNVNLADSFVSVKDGEVFLKNAHIKPYEKATNFVPDSKRDRKLLLNKSEIKKLIRQTEEKGFTIVPTKMYFKSSLVKVEIAVAQGKHLYDKKRVLAERDKERAMHRELNNFN